MKLKIIPPIQVAIFALLMWFINKASGIKHLNFSQQENMSWCIFLIGVSIVATAVYAFKKSNTTTNPLHPEKTSKLVITGIYKYTRNPMYLGMLFVLLTYAIRLGNLYSFIVLPLYVWYITTFQIKPEEEALKKLFGEEFSNYTKSVRRWI